MQGEEEVEERKEEKKQKGRIKAVKYQCCCCCGTAPERPSPTRLPLPKILLGSTAFLILRERQRESEGVSEGGERERLSD